MSAETPKDLANKEFDLMVLGGTPSGISCAITAAQEGKSVLLVNHNDHLGGFMTSGCGGWEAPYDGPRSKIYGEILQRISQYYLVKYGIDSPQYAASIPDPNTRSRFGRPKVEPSVCERIFEEMLDEQPGISVKRGYSIFSVERDESRVSSVVLRKHDGSGMVRVRAKVFVDCTYEGDLAAAAGVRYRVGREARREYGEPHAGIIFTEIQSGDAQPPKPSFNLRPVGEKQRAAGLKVLEPESTGEADPTVMCYNYRLILTKDPKNCVMVQKPNRYDDKHFDAHSRSILPGLPNDKIAWNGAGRLVGEQREYPEADWATRDAIAQRHLDAALSWLWFVQNDPTANPEDREFWKDYGLAKDEFPDNNHLPYEIYVREARRIVGRYVFSENDGVLAPGSGRAPVHADSIAITDWPFDSTACTPVVARGRFVEGVCMASDVWCPAQVPYRCLLPKDVDNLLVPVCLSATHVGWGTIRLEPVWIQTGEAAGLAAAMAIDLGICPSEIETDRLVRKLVKRGSLITFFNDIEASAHKPWYPAVQYLGAQGFFRDYNARPDEHLTPALAKLWIERFRQLIELRDSSTSSPVVDTADTGNVSASEFMTQIRSALEKGKRNVDAAKQIMDTSGLQPNSSITRGQACQVIYALLLENP